MRMLTGTQRRNKPPAPARVISFVVIVALSLGMGLHWVVAQGIAYTGMIIAYSQQGGVVEGLEKTFDGEHPCSMCKSIEEGRSKEKKAPEKRAIVEDLKGILVGASKVPSRVAQLQNWHGVSGAPPESVQHGPETPPPRLSVASAA